MSILWAKGLLFKTNDNLLASEISEKLETIDHNINELVPLPLVEVEVPRLDEPIQVNVVHSDSPVNMEVLPSDEHVQRELNNKTSATVSTLFASKACLLGKAVRRKPLLRRSVFLGSRLQRHSPPETIAVEAFALETSVAEEVYGVPLSLVEVVVLQLDELVDLGFEEKHSGNFEQAASHFSNALSQDPKPDLAFYLIIDSYWLWNNLGESEYALTQLRTYVHKYLPLFNTELRLQFDNWMVKENLVNSFY